MDPNTSPVPEAPIEVQKVSKRYRAKVTSFTRLANAYKDQGRLDLARKCLEAADRKPTHVDVNEKDSSAQTKGKARSAPLESADAVNPAKKQRCNSNDSLGICSRAKLPEEILTLILQQVASPNAVGLTCRTWRRLILSTPSMWRHIVLSQGLSESRCIDALTAYTLRSKATMESVEMPYSFRDCNSPKVRAVLLENAATLQHIKIASRYQDLFYEQLYRHCPNLKYLDIDDYKRVYSERNLDTGELATWQELVVQDESSCPFHLEVFKGSKGVTYGHYLPYMGNLRVIHRLDTYIWGTIHCRIFRDNLIKLNDTLEEWILFRPRKFGRVLAELYSELYRRDVNGGPRMPTESVEFRRLKVLQGWNTAFSPSFTFPALEIANGLAHDQTEGFWDPRSGVSFFETSPRLRKVDFDVSSCTDGHLPELIEALSRLDLLEELVLCMHVDRRCSGANFEKIIAPRTSRTAGVPSRVPCPRLARLHILYKYQSIDALIRVLAERKHLAVGYVFGNMQDSLLVKHYDYPPLHSSTAAEPSAPAEHSVNQVPLHKISRLERIKLCKPHTPEGAIDLLHQFANQVDFVDRTFKQFR